MEYREFGQNLTVASQIEPEGLPGLKQAVFLTIVCNRSDGEGSDQPAFSEIEKEARRLGIEFHYLPTVPQNVTDEQGAAFGTLFNELPKPILGYCRTGRRTATLWTLSQAGKKSVPEILERTSRAGLDFSDLVPRITRKS